MCPKAAVFTRKSAFDFCWLVLVLNSKTSLLPVLVGFSRKRAEMEVGVLKGYLGVAASKGNKAGAGGAGLDRGNHWSMMPIWQVPQ